MILPVNGGAEPAPGVVYAVDVGDGWVVLQLVQAVWMAHVARVLGHFDELPGDVDWARQPQRFVTKIDVTPLVRDGRARAIATAAIPLDAWAGRTIGRQVGRDGLPGPWQVQEHGVWRPFDPATDDRRNMPTNGIPLRSDDIVNQLRLSTRWALDDWEVQEEMHARGEGPEPVPLKRFVGRLRLSFDNRQQADRARLQAEAAGWRVERRGSADRGWLLLLDQREGSSSLPVEAETSLSELAAAHGGPFLGVEPHP